MIRARLIAFAMLATPAAALELDLPGAVIARVQTSPANSVRLPDQPWSVGSQPPQVEGAIRRRALRVAGGLKTTLQLLEPLREQLLQNGFFEVFSCADAACGGFDFRFQLDILGEPDMHVDLGDFRYFLARKAVNDDGPHTVSIVTSRSSTAGFVHITEVFNTAPAEQISPTPEAPRITPEPLPESDLIATLLAEGRAVLEDLDFGSGAGALGGESYQSLNSLGAWLAAEPTAQIVLVGHTDAVGSLESNTQLSQRRAEAVANQLTANFNVSSEQLRAAGAGYLAPRASNLTEEGRALNRRVEVILLSLGG